MDSEELYQCDEKSFGTNLSISHIRCHPNLENNSPYYKFHSYTKLFFSKRDCLYDTKPQIYTFLPEQYSFSLAPESCYLSSFTRKQNP